jgi:hypothetical protein
VVTLTTPLAPAAAGASPTMQTLRRRLAALAVPLALAGVLVLAGPAQAQERDPSTPTWDEIYQDWLTEFIASVTAAAAFEVNQAQQAIDAAHETMDRVDEVLEGSSTEAGDSGTDEQADEQADEDAGEDAEGKDAEGEGEVSAFLDQGAWPTPAATPEVVPEPVGTPVDEPEDVWPRVETPTLAGANAFDIGIGIGLGPSVLVTTTEPQELSGITDVFDQPPADTTRTGGGVVDGYDGGLLGEFGQLSQPVDANPVLGGLDTEVLDPRDVQFLPSAPDLPALKVPASGGRDDLLG